MEGVMVWVIDDVQKTLVVDRQRGPAVVVMGWTETVDGRPCAGGVIESSDLHAKPAGKLVEPGDMGPLADGNGLDGFAVGGGSAGTLPGKVESRFGRG